MAGIIGGRDDKFYEALKNSQPLAFLASISIGIAVLIHSTSQQLPTIYNYAIIAGAMFLASFIASLAFQLLLVTNESKQMARWSQYVFLMLGIFYLVLIMLNFSQTIPQIIELVFGWVLFGLGISFIITLKKEMEKEKMGNLKLGYSITLAIFLLTVGSMLLLFAFYPQILPSATHK